MTPLIGAAMITGAIFLFILMPLLVGWRLWVRDGGKEREE